MANSRTPILTMYCVVALCGILTQDAYAYLDPGTGSYVLQIVLGIAFGATMALRIFWTRIKNLFGGKKKNDPAES